MVPFEGLNGTVRANAVEIGVIAVPSPAAQHTYDKLVDAGICTVLNFAPVQIVAEPNGTENGGLWAVGDGIRLKVPTPLTNRLGPFAGQDVTFGIRPEDLHIATEADPVELTLDAVVEVVERLGSEILLDVAIGRVTMVASVEPTATAKMHERLRLAVNPHRLHFFDSRTEAAI